MARSVRVSDRLYRHATSVSKLQHRSLAQQVEHWAMLGRALDAAGVTTAQVQALLGDDLRQRERTLLKLGLVEQESLYLFPRALVRKATVTFPELAKKKAL